MRSSSRRALALMAVIVTAVTPAAHPTAASGVLSLPSPAAPDARTWYTPISPARLLDTRPTFPTIDGSGRPGHPVSAQISIDLQVAGRAGVPSKGVDAVVVNVTATSPSAPSHLTIWPTGSLRPTASNLNFLKGQTIPNLAVVKIGDSGRVSIYNQAGEVDVVVDVVGYFPTLDGFTPLNPSRLLDTRPGFTTVDGSGRPEHPLAAGQAIDVQITGRGDVPATGVAAVALNITATNPTKPSFITAWPAGQQRPLVSNLNLVAGQTVANFAIVKIGATGAVSLYNLAGSVDLIADVAGYFPADGSFVPLPPKRALETRAGEPVEPGTFLGSPIGPGQSIDVPVLGANGVPAAGVSAVVLNLTAVSPTADTHLTVWPGGTPRPVASNLNVRAGSPATPNLVVAGVGPSGKVSIYNLAGTTAVVADLAGYFLGEHAGWRKVATSRTASCGLDQLGRIGCWGQLDGVASVGELGVPPAQASPFGDAVDVAIGEGSACALRTDGSVWCWGTASLMTATASLNPARILGLSTVVALDAGGDHACALQSDGSVGCWKFGATSATPVAGLTDIVQVDTDLTASCAVHVGGSVSCWGGPGGSGVLGDGTGLDSAVPVTVAGVTDALKAVVYKDRACAVRASGAAACWGNGYLGNGTVAPSLTPTLVIDRTTGLVATDIVEIGLGDTMGCAARTSGGVFCWGANAFSSIPGPVPLDPGASEGLTSATAGLPATADVVVADRHVCADTTAHTIWCFGSSRSGQLGLPAGGDGLWWVTPKLIANPYAT